MTLTVQIWSGPGSTLGVYKRHCQAPGNNWLSVSVCIAQASGHDYIVAYSPKPFAILCVCVCVCVHVCRIFQAN